MSESPARGLPAARVLGYSIQMAGVLAKAHEAGILHCDLKPSNIMVAADGRIKVLDEGDGQFSPDGRLVAYDSNESDNYEVYVRDFPGGTRKWQISANGGIAPPWKGKEIIYDEVPPGREGSAGFAGFCRFPLSHNPNFLRGNPISFRKTSTDGRIGCLLRRPSDLSSGRR